MHTAQREPEPLDKHGEQAPRGRVERENPFEVRYAKLGIPKRGL
jgi:hypothetical protein